MTIYGVLDSVNPDRETAVLYEDQGGWVRVRWNVRAGGVLANDLARLVGCRVRAEVSKSDGVGWSLLSVEADSLGAGVEPTKQAEGA